MVDQLITCFNSRITLKNALFFGLCWIMPKRKEDLLACWKGCFGRHQREYVWTGIPLCIIELFGENVIAAHLKEFNELCQN